MKYKLTKTFYPEFENLKDEYTLELTEEQEAVIKAAREFIRSTVGANCVKIWTGYPEEYTGQDGEDRIGCTQIKVYAHGLYFYCENKYDSHDYWEFEMEKL